MYYNQYCKKRMYKLYTNFQFQKVSESLKTNGKLLSKDFAII